MIAYKIYPIELAGVLVPAKSSLFSAHDQILFQKSEGTV
jgi:hypothetical protein